MSKTGQDEFCRYCKHYGKLSPGHAAICFHKWKELPWNAAVPLTGAYDTCEAFDRADTPLRSPQEVNAIVAGLGKVETE